MAGTRGGAPAALSFRDVFPQEGSMGTRQVTTTAITLALGFILGALTWQQAFAQRKAEEPAKVESTAAGRYRVMATSSQAGTTTVVVCDTATGQCWVLYPSAEGKWHDHGSPVQAKK
jgi:hypothetical protein